MTGVPTNARLVVDYGAVETDGQVPALGSDVTLLDADGSIVAAAIEVVGHNVVITPAGGLIPNHAYQIADRRVIPCTVHLDGCLLTASATPFASFTTGATADVTPPQFEGLRAISEESHLTCDSSSCCGTYEYYGQHFDWLAGSDELAPGDLRYNVYRRSGSSLVPVAGLIEGTEFWGLQVCSGDAGGTHLEPGTYVVRAVDWAGNEDTNVTGRGLGDPCSAHGCSAAAAPARSGHWGWTLAGGALALGALLTVRRRALRPRRR